MNYSYSFVGTVILYICLLCVVNCRAVMVSDSSASGGETAAISDPDKNFTYLLVTEKLPQLIAYMPKIKSSKQGITMKKTGNVTWGEAWE